MGCNGDPTSYLAPWEVLFLGQLSGDEAGIAARIIQDTGGKLASDQKTLDEQEHGRRVVVGVFAGVLDIVQLHGVADNEQRV